MLWTQWPNIFWNPENTTAADAPTGRPGYPFFIAGVYSVFGYSLFAAKAAGVLLAGLTELCAWIWMRRYFSGKTAMLALFILVCWPARTLHLDLLSYDDLVTALIMLSLVTMPDIRKPGPNWKAMGSSRIRPRDSES